MDNDTGTHDDQTMSAISTTISTMQYWPMNWITILVLMTLNSMSTISANFTNFDLDESDGDTSTHPGTSTVIQTTSQLEDDRLLSQNIAPKSAREDGQRAQRASRDRKSVV